MQPTATTSHQSNLHDALACWTEMLVDARDSIRRGWSRSTHSGCYAAIYQDIAAQAFDAIAEKKKRGAR